MKALQRHFTHPTAALTESSAFPFWLADVELRWSVSLLGFVLSSLSWTVPCGMRAWRKCVAVDNLEDWLPRPFFPGAPRFFGETLSIAPAGPAFIFWVYAKAQVK